jgi:hypothetical protein
MSIIVDKLIGARVRVVVQSEGSIADFSNNRSLPNFQLYELLLTMETEGVTIAMYENLRDHYDLNRSRHPFHAEYIQRTLLGCLSTTLQWCDAEFNFSVQTTALSVVVGSKSAIAKAREAGLLCPAQAAVA